MQLYAGALPRARERDGEGGREGGREGETEQGAQDTRTRIHGIRCIQTTTKTLGITTTTTTTTAATTKTFHTNTASTKRAPYKLLPLQTYTRIHTATTKTPHTNSYYYCIHTTRTRESKASYTASLNTKSTFRLNPEPYTLNPSYTASERGL